MSQAEPNSHDTVNAIFKVLDRTQKEIRLIALEPAFLETDPIVCTLEQVRLDDGPKYSALSWAWGNVDRTETIRLQGHEWQAPRNMVVALRALRQKIEPWKTWIDALCINQSQDSEALKERGHQVQLMRAIYANAERLFAWVGESRPWTSDFFMYIRQLAKLNRTIDQACLVIQSIGREKDSDDLTFMKWLWDFAMRAWWKRLWVLQEIVLAPQAVVVCGPHMILLSQVLTAFLVIRVALGRLRTSRADSNKMISVGVLITTIEDLGKYGPSQLLDGETVTAYPYQRIPKKSDEGFICFAKLLTACRFRLSSDPRDMIYGLLGMTTDNVATSIVPRYDKSVMETYTETTFTLIERTGSLFILSQAQVVLWDSSDISSCGKKLPSWVPDWSVKRQGLGYSVELRCQSRLERACHFSACLRPRAEAKLIQNRMLQLRGIMVDNITSLHKIWEKCGGHYLPNLRFYDEWTASSGGSSYSDGYIAGGTSTNAYWRSWVHDMLPSDAFEGQFEGHPAQAKRCVGKFVDDCVAWRSSLASWQRSFVGEDLKKIPRFPFPSLLKESTFTGIRFLVTEDKFLGLGNTMMLPGDVVYVLAGGSHPCVLRPEADHAHHFRLVGECYLHGIMDGQALKRQYGSIKKRKGKDAPQPGPDAGAQEVWEDVILV